MRCENAVDALDSDGYCRSDECKPYYNRGDRLCFSMPVGMIFVRRPHRNPQSEVDYQTRNHIGGRLQAISNQGKRMAEETCYAFRERQTEIDEDANQSGAHALLADAAGR